MQAHTHTTHTHTHTCDALVASDRKYQRSWQLWTSSRDSWRRSLQRRALTNHSRLVMRCGGVWLEDTGREGGENDRQNFISLCISPLLYPSPFPLPSPPFLPSPPPIPFLSPLSSSPPLPPLPPLQHADGESDEATVHCATCGVHVSVRKALGHMERCFMKVWWGACPICVGGVSGVIDSPLCLV